MNTKFTKSEKTKQKLRDIAVEQIRKGIRKGLFEKGHIGYGLGVPRTKEVRQKIKDSNILFWKTKERLFGEKNPFYGKKHSEETKKKWSSIRKNRPNPKASITLKKLYAEGKLKPWNKGIPFMIGKDNPFYGKHHKESSIQKYKLWRHKQVFPKKDTSIETKMQKFLKSLRIEFMTHQYMKEIEHGYQCDIMIPVQEGITKKTIIECFGTYWHKYPIGNERDTLRCDELRKAGWRVLVFWENEIHAMHINDVYLKVKEAIPSIV